MFLNSFASFSILFPGTQAYIYMPESYQNLVDGLCGNFDRSDDNEFTLDRLNNAVTVSVEEYADSFKRWQKCADTGHIDMGSTCAVGHLM